MDHQLFLRSLVRGLGAGRPLFLWGAGSGGRHVLHQLKSLGIEPAGFIDSNAGLHGHRVEGTEVFSPARLTNSSEAAPYVLVSSSFWPEIVPILQGLGYHENRDYLLLLKDQPPETENGALAPSDSLYRPTLRPWLSEEFETCYRRISQRTLVCERRAWTLRHLARQARALSGEFWECGVYRGGTARLLADVLAEEGSGRVLRLFDTFQGMPDTDPGRDRHRAGDFADTTVASVRRLVPEPFVAFHRGFIPETFAPMSGQTVAFAHIDVDLYRSVMDCCAFIYPRLAAGGTMIFDDYGFPSCPGAREAVDEFFSDKPESPLILEAGSAVVTRLPVQ